MSRGLGALGATFQKAGHFNFCRKVLATVRQMEEVENGCAKGSPSLISKCLSLSLCWTPCSCSLTVCVAFPGEWKSWCGSKRRFVKRGLGFCFERWQLVNYLLAFFTVSPSITQRLAIVGIDLYWIKGTLFKLGQAFEKAHISFEARRWGWCVELMTSR